MRVEQIAEQREIRSGDRFEHTRFEIASDIAYRNKGGAFLMALERVEDVIFRNVQFVAPWTLPEQAPWYGDMIQLHAGGAGIRFENVEIHGAPRMGIDVRGATQGTILRDIRGSRCFTLLAVSDGPHECLRVQNVSMRDGWIDREKQPTYDNGPSELVAHRAQGWNAVRLTGVHVGIVEHVSAWGETGGIKLTHCAHTRLRSFATSHVMVQESVHVSVEDGTVNRYLASRRGNHFNGIQLSHPGEDVTIRNVRVQNDGHSKHGVQVGHGMNASVDGCAFFGWSEQDVSNIHSSGGTLDWGEENQVFPEKSPSRGAR